MRFCVVSQSTLSVGQGRRVPVEGVRASWRARRLPCQLRAVFLLGIGDSSVAHELLEHVQIHGHAVRPLGDEFGEERPEPGDVLGDEVG